MAKVMALGTKVKMTKKFAKDHLDNPDYYLYGTGELDKQFHKDVLVYLACCMGEPIFGTVVKHGMRDDKGGVFLGIQFSGGLFTYVERSDIIKA